MKRKLFKAIPGTNAGVLGQSAYALEHGINFRIPAMIAYGIGVNATGYYAQESGDPIQQDTEGRLQALTLELRNKVTSRRTYSAAYVYTALCCGTAVKTLSIIVNTVYKMLILNKNAIPASAQPSKLEDMLYKLENCNDRINTYADQLPVFPYINEVEKICGYASELRNNVGLVVYPQYVIYTEGVLNPGASDWNVSNKMASFDVGTIFNSDYNVDGLVNSVNTILSTVNSLLVSSDTLQAAGDLVRLGYPTFKPSDGILSDIKQSAQTLNNTIGIESNDITGQTYWDAHAADANYAPAIAAEHDLGNGVTAMINLHLRSEGKDVGIEFVDILGVPINFHYQGIEADAYRFGVNALSLIALTSITSMAVDDVSAVNGACYMTGTDETSARHNSIILTAVTSGFRNAAIVDDHSGANITNNYCSTYVDDEYSVYPVLLAEIHQNWVNDMLETAMIAPLKSDKNFSKDSKVERKKSKESSK